MDQLIQDLQSAVGRRSVLSETDELLVYECDGLPQHKRLPRAVVFPESTEAVAEVMKTLRRFEVPFTPRGAGTGLSGGALALNSGVVIELARMRNILKVDPVDRTAVVQTGVVNLHVSRAAAPLGLHYVPDPSSQPTCTIGGNIAENAGGIHCLKYGTTTDHVLAAKVVLSDGSVVDLKSGETGMPGYDLLGIFIGSEGTFGIATEATLRLTPMPQAVRTLLAEFADVDSASHAVSAIIAAGVMPAALEMMDREIIRAIEASVFAAGLPPDAGAALLIELDGLEAGIDDEAEKVRGICLEYGARKCRLAHDEVERKKLWAARKGAFGAIGRIAPDSMIQDAVVPRSRLPEIMQQSYRIAAKYQLVLANVFHAGDGNLHPLICFDSRSADEVRRVKEAGRELMETCVRAGGSITGEHGVGLDKRDYLPLIFSENDMEAMLRVRTAFDPSGLCNPGKIIPTLRGCGEARAIAKSTDVQLLGSDLSGSIDPAPIDHDNGIVFDSSLDISQQLSLIVGEQDVATRADGLMVATPASTKDVSTVMKLASATQTPVVPAGAATWLDVGNPPGKIGFILSTNKLNRIIEHVPADLIASAEAGVTLHDFNIHLSKNGQWLPLDPPDRGTSTLGGIIATGLAGPQLLGYGPPRRFVIGMKVVLADGRAIKVGGKVVKNVAGYDLSKLFTGSYGTLGVITELTFKLRPLPALDATAVLQGPLVALFSIASEINSALIGPVAMEILSSEFADQANSTQDCALLVRFAGSEKAVTHQLELTRKFAAQQHQVQTTSKDSEVAWRTVANPASDSSRVVSRVIVTSSKVVDFVKCLEASESWQASPGTGVIRIFNSAEDDLVALAQRLHILRTHAGRLGGSLVIENAPLELKRKVDCWGGFNSATSLMARIKQQLDAGNILSPGRF